MESLNVLVVDDSMLAMQVLKSALEELGHKVVKPRRRGLRRWPPMALAIRMS